MSVAAVTAYLETLGLGDRVRVLSHSSATVEEAAQALGCQPREIAKTMSLLQEQGPVLIVAAGDGKIDNKKYKAQFHQKAKMIPGPQVEDLVGHPPGGVCPFACKEGVAVYLDVSLRRFGRSTPPPATVTAPWSSPCPSWRKAPAVPAGWTCVPVGRKKRKKQKAPPSPREKGGALLVRSQGQGQQVGDELVHGLVPGGPAGADPHGGGALSSRRTAKKRLPLPERRGRFTCQVTGPMPAGRR